jgi:hypothetical protein
VLGTVDRFRDLGGTSTAQAVRRHYEAHDRIVVVTDEQTHWSPGGHVFQSVPERVPTYTWNLAGYAVGHAPTGPNRYTFGGLSDAAFRLVPLIEAGDGDRWPWESAAPSG